MKVSNEYLQYIMQKLEPLGQVKSRAMFGGYGVFHEGMMFALIADDTLYFKVDDSNRVQYEQAGSTQFKPMPYYEVPAEVLEDTNSLHEWAHFSIGIAHSTAAKKKRQR